MFLTFQKGLYIDELRNSKQNGRTVKDGEKVLKSFKIFDQVNSRVSNGVVVGFGPKGRLGRMCDSVRLKCGHTRIPMLQCRSI